ncbi:UPF0481 protein At3g47200-like isoform X2 [Elaeis guineensis]|uniref:UPF0481 protein At3g47200-like isoform X2 n=1 Tax=Elaeis guineensis var. tenera TaxID=51953 RepID=UPI003C6DAC1D
MDWHEARPPPPPPPQAPVRKTPPEIERVRDWIRAWGSRQDNGDGSGGEIEINDAYLLKILKTASKIDRFYLRKKPSTIYRVPKELYSSDKKAYEPKAVCVGPFFYHLIFEEHLQSMHTYKWACVHKLLSKHNDPMDLLRRCLTEMKKLEEYVRSCYSETFQSIDSDDFTRMLMLDGCFLLHLLQRHADSGEKPKVDDVDAAQVIGRLWIWNLVKKQEEPKFYIPVEEVHHLLHLIYLSVLPCPQYCNSSPMPQPPLYWIPSAKELKMAGMKFQKRKKEGGFLSFLDVKFSDGVMEIPQLEVHDYSISLFRNFIAFEQCYADTQCHVTVYAAFMDFLIRTAEDVRLLYLNDILINSMTVDKDATYFFSHICNEVHYALDTNYLRKLFSDVNEYHDSKWPRLRAYLSRQIKGSPWGYVSMNVAAVGLLLTVFRIH